MKVTVDPQETILGTLYSILTQNDKRGRMRSYLIKDEKGVSLFKTALRKKIAGMSSPEADAVHTPPIPIFLYPSGTGPEVFGWKGILKISFIKKNITLKGSLLGMEKITVPAGTFDCLKIQFIQTRDNTQIEENAWYAKGVGQVKYTGGQYTKELKKYDVR